MQVKDILNPWPPSGGGGAIGEYEGIDPKDIHSAVLLSYSIDEFDDVYLKLTDGSISRAYISHITDPKYKDMLEAFLSGSKGVSVYDMGEHTLEEN